MNQNEQRRQAQRQKRGTLRVEEILQVANTLFAEWGYDNVTMHMIATQAHTSPGSLYQFFPNKEAVTQAFVTLVAQDLYQVYAALRLTEGQRMPFPVFLTTFIDRLIAFNRTFPGYLALEVGATLSAPLATLLADVQQEAQGQLDALIAPYWPQSTAMQRRLPLLVSYRVFLALLPLTLRGNEQQQQAVVQEMKQLLLGYWKPLLALD